MARLLKKVSGKLGCNLGSGASQLRDLCQIILFPLPFFDYLLYLDHGGMIPPGSNVTLLPSHPEPYPHSISFITVCSRNAEQRQKPTKSKTLSDIQFAMDLWDRPKCNSFFMREKKS